MNDYSGTLSSEPNIYISPKLTKIFVQGLSILNNS